MMNRHSRQQAVDHLTLRLRWFLIAATGLLAFGHVPIFWLVGVLALQGISNAVAHFVCRDLGRYQHWGSNVVSGLRLADGLILAFASFLPATSGDGLWLIALPIICMEALSTRRWKRSAAFAGTILAVQVFGTLHSGHGIRAAIVPAIALGLSPIVGLVLAGYRSREEVSHAHDRRLEALMASTSALATSQDLRSMLLQTLKSAVRDLGATAGYVVIVSEDDPTNLRTEVAYGTTGDFTFPETVPFGVGISGYVVKMGQPIAIQDNGGDPLDCDGVSLRVRSAVSVPVTTRAYAGAGQAPNEQIIGAMTLVNSDSADAVQGEDMELLHSLSSLIGTAVTNARMEEKQRSTFLRTLESLATALEARDDYTRGHSQRVCELSMMIGQNLGVGMDALEELRIGTILHDIGKIGVPDAILNKPGRLTEEEFLFMKSHPVIGYEICRPLMLSEGVLMIIRNHHEKLDGSGYPDGLKGGELPLSLRIVCVADAFDAMSSRRPYRGVMDINHVLSELSKGAGVQFDPVVVETLKNLLTGGLLDEMYRAFWEPMEELAA